ncbi:hypothetical protein C1752_17186 [Acaryochloris thomasi RCC1774]|uniref:Phosphoadenosine phosphosulphate reductase domain-containing protein n=1 Tax=Acaryochloris thomasi RCC1774 TaxID=1764569 RepID=A0A2W1JLM0_9CYAN|nr:hypothetical protein [Acaryochloris thomasi]PZD70171.1 hypothetical protein C1752_17186 [Acaryochloris thomasi RCC1774]
MNTQLSLPFCQPAQPPPLSKYDRTIIAFSGGKDSLACVLWTTFHANKENNMVFDNAFTDQMMYGQHAVRVPAWLYTQPGKEEVIFVGATKDLRASHGNQRTHQFMLGEIILRPHFAVASDNFRGHGATALLTANHMDFLLADDMEVICDPMGKLGTLCDRYSKQIQAITGQ